MSKRPFDPVQQKITRNDRFAQMSHQEKIIEEKKREIQAKLEANRKQNVEESKEKPETKTNNNNNAKDKEEVIANKPGLVNAFSNDGSFLEQFKQMKGKKVEPKMRSFNKFKEREDKNFSDKNRKVSSRRRSPSPLDRSKKPSRFSTEQKITINTGSFSSQNFDPPPRVSTPQQDILRQIPQQQSVIPQIPQQAAPAPITSEILTGPPLLKNETLSVATSPFPTMPEQSAVCIARVPIATDTQMLVNVPPPQMVQQTQLTNIVLTPQTQNVLVATPTSVLATVTLPPPLLPPQSISLPAQATLQVRPQGVPTVELTSIPPPNPIQVQNIPQPEPLNTMNIPPPAPIQVQNIPTPSTLQLNEIPNPKPIDILAIPTPNEEKSISGPDFIKNIPPPNKSVPPPSIGEVTSIPPPNTLVQTSFISSPQNLPAQNVLITATLQSNGTPAPLQPVSIQMPVQNPPQLQNNFTVVQNPNPSPTSHIPALMSQPVLPPPGMGVNVSCPPPLLTLPSGSDVTQPPPNFMSQPPPITSQLPPMTIPPPSAIPLMGGTQVPPPFRDMNAVFPPGTPDFEAMASLARMVADCGPSVEGVVKQKKNQDPNLWFLFYKESAAYRQYTNLVEQYKREKEQVSTGGVKTEAEDVYEPEMALEDIDDIPIKTEIKQETGELGSVNGSGKRKRRSRWGDKDPNAQPPPVVSVMAPTLSQPSPNQGTPMLSKVTRNDPGLLQYAMTTYGSTNLSDEDWKKAEDSYKIHILYQDMMRRKEQLEKLKSQGKNKYEYDSDEDTEGGTWEHKLREKEMTATERWAVELTRQAEGKHHIGDFLPPEELKRFMEKSNAVKEGRQPNFSDYKEFKIKEDNIGFKMLQKLGWTEGQGLGSNSTGIVEPVNKGAPREHTQGLGLNLNEATEGEDEYESYRKRMMLAYRFRPNPLNNPRRPYY